jgi:hypothetical protein
MVKIKQQNKKQIKKEVRNKKIKHLFTDKRMSQNKIK